MKLFWVFSGILMFLSVNLTEAQPPALFPVSQVGRLDTKGPNSTQSDPQAVTVIEASIAAMGGRSAWQQAGSATAKAVITLEGSSSQTIDWSDDWSKGFVRFRRQSNVGETSMSPLVGADIAHRSRTFAGKTKSIQHDNGVVILAMAYPAPALILSLAKYNCTFQLGKPINPRLPLSDDNPDEVPITERCPDAFYPTGAATLIWKFSKASGMPQSVELPICGLPYHIVRSQMVRFTAFRDVQGRLVPSELQVRRVTGHNDQISVSDTTFAQRLPDSTFQTGIR